MNSVTPSLEAWSDVAFLPVGFISVVTHPAKADGESSTVVSPDPHGMEVA
jgi:hypothetical protein